MYGLYMNVEDQFFVCLQKSDFFGKIVVFVDNGMFLKEICFDFVGQLMFLVLRYVMVMFKGYICVVDDKQLVVVDLFGKLSLCIKLEEDWEGKFIIMDMNDNFLIVVCLLEFGFFFIYIISVDGRVVKCFIVEGFGIFGINVLVIDQQYEELVFWIGILNGYVIIVKFFDMQFLF